MPKAQKTPWPGYWEPTPRNQVTISRASRSTIRYERERRPQRDASVGDGQQRGKKRGADFADEDSEGEVFHTPKARCMTVDKEDDAEMRSVSKLDADESQHASERLSLQHLTVEERLATMEEKMQSLDETRQKHIGDIGYLRPRTTELASEDRVIKKRINGLEEMIVRVNDNVSAQLELQNSCLEANRDLISINEKVIVFMERTKKDLKMARKDLEVMRAAHVEDRATISNLRKELSELKDGGSTTTENTST
ncbi:hypothetical protein BHE90_009389 [Fusarium euwallaceae]|uniref:Uncharacterized protein n=1 Tax=Fusarium euwallaceae TaxID=1147111 RepID=A0A430LKF8_9HYPO|nr:hypothetical protein BHE90_009389 [Fusarium euwallaceae]